ncbi:S8 family serine peptidase [Thiocapsa bogorovii]|uniref:S8 family serine peptidase n=1 Tax=Thiocapsa bogorovii TaxID=521689 RepID=UPI001E5243A5|nr:S8 family serine peptidase [Thiocapsa bogorovii]UHD16375.1 S8 family serine peptidase [Thiocapsa bogorovii]
MFDRDALKSEAFSWKSALSLVLASQLAYVRSPEEVVGIATASWGFDGCIPFAVGDTEGFVAWDAASVVVSYRGTTSVGDWLMDFDVAQTERPYGAVHGGFSDGFEAVRDSLEAALAQAAADGKQLWLTGHSLGGALATVTAAELADRFPRLGIYTYGQPKALGARAARFVRERFEDRCQRFVNDDDVVPTVPPGYRHVGRLFWFDAQGGLKAAGTDTEAADATSAPRELSDAEFTALQAELRSVRDAIDAEPIAAESVAGAEGVEAERQMLFDASVEGLLPSFRDHALKRYIAKIRAQLERPAQVDEAIAEVIAGALPESLGLESVVPLEQPGGRRVAGPVPVLLRVRDPAWEPPQGVVVQSRLGNIVSATASAMELETLRQDRGVLSIDSSRDGGTPELADSKTFVRAADVHRPPLAEQGDAAIVGIIDAGIDVLHEAFQDDAGKTRILHVWDQRIPSGPSPSDLDGAPFSQSYGRLYSQSEIQDMIEQDAAPANLRDFSGHGTHVASIAAGRPVGGFAGGLAPAAKLVVVIPHMRSEPGAPPSIGYSSSHVDALAFVQAVAAEAGLPVAVNVSLGMNAGAHDGSSTLEAAFDEFSGKGRLPGVALVKSAGNERGHKGHARVDVPLNGLAEIAWEASADARNEDYIEVWFNAFDGMDFTLITPSGRALPTVSETNPRLNTTSNGNLCRMTLTRNHRDNGDNLLVISIEPDGRPIQPGRWRLQLLGKSILGQGGGVTHAWVEREGSRAVAFESGDNDEMTLSIPGTADYVITVGACGSALPVMLTDSSSWGPTRDQRPKPDLVAPGADIVAARAGMDDHQATVGNTGTSMAAPHVTGSIALVFSKRHKDPAKPQVNAVQIRHELIATAQNFNGVFNKSVGFGVLDTLAFFNRF